MGGMSDMKDIKAIKFAAESYVAAGGNPVALFKESAEWLYSCYEATGDKICLKAAVQMIQAYMEMGLLYDAAKDIFDKILEEGRTSFEEEFPKRLYGKKGIKCTISQVREILGYWPYSREKRYNAQWVAESICEKVNNREYGCYYYGKREEEVSFELLILKEDAYLMDLLKGRIYVFEQT